MRLDQSENSRSTRHQCQLNRTIGRQSTNLAVSVTITLFKLVQMKQHVKIGLFQRFPRSGLNFCQLVLELLHLEWASKSVYQTHPPSWFLHAETTPVLLLQGNAPSKLQSHVVVVQQQQRLKHFVPRCKDHVDASSQSLLRRVECCVMNCVASTSASFSLSCCTWLDHTTLECSFENSICRTAPITSWKIKDHTQWTAETR